MSFYEEMKKYDKRSLVDYMNQVSAEEVKRTLSKDCLSINDFMVLVSHQATNYLEEMAARAHKLTLSHFGKAVVLYAPLYLANYCVNHCLYCGFNSQNQISRRQLTMNEVTQEAESISKQGIRHILLLTGESRKYSSVEYIMDCVKEVSKFFTSISIEVYPLEQDEYKRLSQNGVDGLTVYQEVYDEECYKTMHPLGPKKDYQYRLQTPERGCEGGLRSVGIGALLGLSDWRTEAFYTALHALYLTRKFPDVEIGISLPRMCPHIGSFEIPHPVDDKKFVQILLAFRLLLPHVGITLSTRELAEFRDNLVGLGITRMSAGSVTEVGGYSSKKGDGQFEVSDNRTVEEIRQMLYQKGYQPVFKDWQYI